MKINNLILITAIILSACGGGTRGTGLGESADISSTAKAEVSVSGQIVGAGPGVTVTSLSSGEQTETDATGGFEIFGLSDSAESNVILEIEDGAETYRIDLGVLQPGQYTLQIYLSRLQGTLNSEDDTEVRNVNITKLG